MKKTTSQAAKILFSCLVILAGLAGAASAGTISVGAEDITPVVGETITLPVIVSDANNMCGYQLTLHNENPSAADIEFNQASANAGLFTWNDSTGIIVWSGYRKDQSISGTQELFKIDVTPKTTEDIRITLEVDVTQEGTSLMNAENVNPYSGSTAVISSAGDILVDDKKPIEEYKPQEKSEPLILQTVNPVSEPSSVPSAVVTQEPTKEPVSDIPLGEPTVSLPAKTPAASTPVPFISLILGLGAAVYLWRRH